ncbi:NAD(P)-dependent oxidoreductase [Muricoccus pecuniae]|uniref:D-3-phosphoglycerate dehydrogenase n=1 Tax=Muricoccus pecuniae TaxID=693023 RepID=A0A840Y3B8_9PROT|nr:NAD(P)-dependent oxidoreductase [Roseomonas pecuniae]MBB5695225.1 D-3-phosphoglycerate dehydrogenase [Roseomonas pecuniae]
MKVFLSHSTETFPGYFGERALAALREHAEVVRNTTDRELRDAELAQAAAGCQAIIAYRGSPGTAATFAASPDLVAFLRCAVDISTIDVPAASAHGILVTRATPGFTDSVAELGIGMLVDLARGVTRVASAYHRGEIPAPTTGVQLSASTLGLVGYGRIARRMAVTARALGMRVLAYDPYASPEDAGVQAAGFAEVLSADFVVCLAIASPETADIMDAKAFAAMRRGAFFINLSRGELVDEAALEAALDSGHLAGAAMDVGRAPDQMPSPRLARRPDVIATPHLAGLTPEAAEHQAMDTVRQVAALAAGRVPEGAVNIEAAHRLARLQR